LSNRQERFNSPYPDGGPHGFAVATGQLQLQQQKPTKGKYLPTDPAARKKIPLFSGLMKYFPDALVAVAKVSQAGNDQHNPGEKLHWSRDKSSDHEDTLMRHLLESGEVDVDGHRHSAKMAWRALATLQLEIEAAEGKGEQSASEK
jgi:hypothetical protein